MQTPHGINRRQALAASVAALAAVADPAAAADDERTEWHELWEAYHEQEQRHIAATDAYYEAYWQARQSYPPQHIRIARTWCGCGAGKPLGWHLQETVNLPDPVTDRPRAGFISRGDIDEHYRRMIANLARPAADGAIGMQNTATPQASKAHWVQSQSDIDSWEAECRAIDARFNVAALDAAREAEEERHIALEQAIIEKPSTGLLGIAVKLALWARTELTDTLECAGGENNEEGQQWLASPAVAAWADALRLAGLPQRMGMERPVTAG